MTVALEPIDWERLEAAAESDHEAEFFAARDGVPLSVVCDQGWSVLHHAAFYRRSSWIERCAPTPVDLEQRTRKGYGVLHQAARSGSGPTVTTVLRLGGSAQAVDRERMTPLHHAAWLGADAAVEALLAWTPAASLDLSTTDERGLTPLHWAVRGNHAAVVARLLRAGADPDAPDARGFGAVQVARWNQDPCVLAKFAEFLARQAQKDLNRSTGAASGEGGEGRRL